jgi:glycosyltransferase involved in cell wall biosynthesis
VIVNGTPEPRVTRPKAAVRSDLGLDESDFVALLVATLRPEKRVDVFVDAVSAAHERDARIRGLVAGDGPELESVRSRTAGSRVVSVLGHRSDVTDLMAASDVVCLTSYAESLPMVVVEAMAVGRPVVSTDVGGVAAVVAHGESGLVIPVDRGEALTGALRDLAANPGLVDAMGRASRRRWEEQFTAERMADRYDALLREALAAA